MVAGKTTTPDTLDRDISSISIDGLAIAESTALSFRRGRPRQARSEAAAAQDVLRRGNQPIQE
jgi:hypothetical protein